MDRRQIATAKRAFAWAPLALVVVAALASLAPVYWMLMNSFQPNTATRTSPPAFYPTQFTLENFTYLFGETPVLRWLGNSLFVSLVSASFVVYLSALAAFPLAKRRLPGARLLFWIALVFMVVPREVYLVPLFIEMRNLHLTDNLWGLILPAVAWPFGVFLMRQFISTVPSELFEAAQIDGASSVRMFHQILLPVVKPAVGALAVFAFVHSWNDYIWQLIMISSPNKRTLPLGVATLSEELFTNYGYVLAAASFGALPLLVIFVFFQRFFTSGLTVGAVKG